MTLISPKRITAFTIALCAMSLGGATYLLFRPTSLTLFSWIEKINMFDYVDTVRENINFSLPGWVIYSLPDGLWILSYMLVIGAIWDFDLKNSAPALFFLPALALISELLQLPGIVPGTFDPGDILAYALGITLAMVYIIKNNRYEKNQI